MSCIAVLICYIFYARTGEIPLDHEVLLYYCFWNETITVSQYEYIHTLEVGSHIIISFLFSSYFILLYYSTIQLDSIGNPIATYPST